MNIGFARTTITPEGSVWLTGYGDRDHKSEGVYAPLHAGAVYLEGGVDRALVITADVIGYSPPADATMRQAIADATGLLPRQVVLTATHTHCAPFFTPWNMPGAVEAEYAEFLQRKLRDVSLAAIHSAVTGRIEFSRASSTFGVNRRLPDGAGSVTMAPNPDGSIDRDLDTLWLRTDSGELLGTLTIYGCHPTSLSGYLIGPDYPGFLCRHVEADTGAPALFATGCAGDVRPWFKRAGASGFLRPSLDELEAAGAGMAREVLSGRTTASTVEGDRLHIDHVNHRLPYADLPTREELLSEADSEDPRARNWSRAMLQRLDAGGLADASPHEVQVLQLNPGFRVVFLGGEVLSEIGLHIKRELAPATTINVAYANGLIAYIPSANAYPLGGYEVHGSHRYFLRPAAFTADCEARIVETLGRLLERLG
jgi:neutral ceramidase